MFFIINPKVETMPDADNNEILTPIEEIKKEREKRAKRIPEKNKSKSRSKNKNKKSKDRSSR